MAAVFLHPAGPCLYLLLVADLSIIHGQVQMHSVAIPSQRHLFTLLNLVMIVFAGNIWIYILDVKKRLIILQRYGYSQAPSFCYPRALTSYTFDMSLFFYNFFKCLTWSMASSYTTMVKWFWLDQHFLSTNVTQHELCFVDTTDSNSWLVNSLVMGNFNH